MWWRGVLVLLLCFATLGESTDRFSRFLSINLGAETSSLYKWTVASAGIFVAVALLLSTFLIFEHLAAYNKPEEQKFLVGLILMVPVYAVESFLSLLNAEAAFNCEVVRDCYEAFALYCFERYLIACLGGEESTIEFMENQNWITSSLPIIDETYAYGVVEHPFPLNCCLKDWKLGSDFYQGVKIGIVQYMILKLICAALAMLFQSLGVYGEGKFEWGYAYPYLAVVLNFSQTWALYCLVQFYSVTKNKLEPIKPLAKFLTFKSIVFLTWWQGVAVAFLFSFGALQGSLALVLKTRIQDYIICIEMGVAAVVHLYVFPAVPYKRGERCVRNVAVLADYASLGTPPDPDEVQDCERSTRVRFSRQEDRVQTPKLHQSVRDVVIGSGEIIVDDMRFTVSHVVEPVERGLAKINKTFHQISENVKRYDEERRKSKDDTHLVPLISGTKEFSDVRENLPEGSLSDSGVSDGKRPQYKSRTSSSWLKHR
ncbi:protein LAZ1 homolog 1 [Salvia miltiorrhiza]|uniref:protein LAZ1 homolog 1 n=1 Tax=Salvia miltiorrhiza TaxID=226208 RepID=UPI0025ACE299|nr:protein LAZ1 homolog 1 [Salvia miltiorrhiza]XP_057773135.1 protein LAZ1 homolog 1 [Salvia miltiorrhiza]XP_057773141.1 protein LAZ1 homolog 1 [Salvia miltiorrhiza]XP_057773148.1 protein LAZ1 homolog 1 [Salvia miltiorrhiza]XP_057773156.1 protein LAZ1 homolog 1 [Salvia miltiorrhiza]XP_057773165.1 protein LAZ1 homolog 1 [Salvia miltiorrhiza]XP_057773173.1 protein LAZ1 homolog 1 [Salvia miltiorrhiza]XP_057773180.1 protein LAZ1 homolog 1 [Salvia miltiorrhiza]XP_057773189.1 protein LAZ1 homolog